MLVVILLSRISVSFLLQTAPVSSLTSGSSSPSNEEPIPLSSDFSFLSSGNSDPDLFDVWPVDDNTKDASPFVFSSSSNDEFDFLDDPNLLISSDSTFLDTISSSIDSNDGSTLAGNTLIGSSNNNNFDDVSCASSTRVKRNNEQSSCVSSPYDRGIDLHLPNLPQVFGGGDSANSDFSHEGVAPIRFSKFCQLIGFPIGMCCEGPLSNDFTLADFLIFNRIENCEFGMCLTSLLIFSIS